MERAAHHRQIDRTRDALRQHARHWLITGVAGFIGSNLLEALLMLGQRVTGVDNFMTGKRDNLEQVRAAVGAEAWQGFHFIEGDIRDAAICQQACAGVDFVLHQAALGSVTRSLENPILTSQVNVIGFLNVLTAARDAGVKRFVYAASSSTYGDHPDLPKIEARIGQPLSPYAVTKYVNELYAGVYARCYQTASIGLRYFNVFGPRQDPGGAYAAVIPQWIAAMIGNQGVCIHGDGETSRDFCFVENVVQANLLAATVSNPDAINQVYNVAANARTTLNRLHQILLTLLVDRFPHLRTHRPRYVGFRAGDVRHSQGDISKAETLLGYAPTHHVEQGLAQALEWYVAQLAEPARPEP